VAVPDGVPDRPVTARGDRAGTDQSDAARGPEAPGRWDTGVSWRGLSTGTWLGALTLLLLVVALGAAALTTATVAGWDRAGVEAVGRLRTDSLTPWMKAVTFGSSAPVVLPAVVAAGLVLWRRSGWLADSVRLVLVVGVGWSAVMALKPVFDRGRPAAAMGDVLSVEPLVAEPVGASYPSGHTALATGVALALVWALRHATTAVRVGGALAGVLLVAVVGLSRVYLGVHYPSDLVGSVLTVTATTLLLTGLVPGPRPPRDRGAEHPGPSARLSP
jgi:membrane-associated phospholipid phosphatase